MTGLEKMKSQILEEAKAAAGEILADAEKQANAVKEKGKEEAEAACREISQKSEEEVKAVEERAVSSCDLQRRKALLTAKQEIIKEVLDSAYQTLLNADDETYFALLRKMLHKFVLAQEGEICFSDTDLKRLPQGFEEEIQAIAREKGGHFQRKAERYAADLFLYMEELKKTVPLRLCSVPKETNFLTKFTVYYF